MNYRHYKSSIYEIVSGAKLKADPGFVMTAYKLETGMIWTLP